MHQYSQYSALFYTHSSIFSYQILRKAKTKAEVDVVFVQLESMEGDGRVLVFFKPHPCVVSEDNLHRSVLVSSMLESPISTLYQALRQVYGPVLLQVSLMGRVSHACELAVRFL